MSINKKEQTLGELTTTRECVKLLLKKETDEEKKKVLEGRLKNLDSVINNNVKGFDLDGIPK